MESELERSSPAPIEPKGKTLSRNDATWESIKDDIFHIYMTEDNTLTTTMTLIECMHNFTKSERKWKEKLKEWNFVKNLTRAEVEILIAKAEKRAEVGKDTIFFHHGNIIPQSKIINWKKRIALCGAIRAKCNLETPASIAYFTPQLPRRMNSLSPRNTVELVNPSVDASIDVFLFFGTDSTSYPYGLLSHFEDPVDMKAALQYCELKIKHGLTTLSWRFRPIFVTLLFHAVKIPGSFDILLEVLSAIIRYDPSTEKLVELLGQTLAINRDIERATILAKAASTGFGQTFSYVLGRWLHLGGFYEESIPYLQDAFLDNIVPYVPSFLPFAMPCADLLLESYKHLGHEKDWRMICYNLCRPGEEQFSERIWSAVNPGITASAVPLLERVTGHLPFFYVQQRLAGLFEHILWPKHIASIHLFNVAHHLRTSPIGESNTLDSILHSLEALQSLRVPNAAGGCMSCAEEIAQLSSRVALWLTTVTVAEVMSTFELVLRQIDHCLLRAIGGHSSHSEFCMETHIDSDEGVQNLTEQKVIELFPPSTDPEFSSYANENHNIALLIANDRQTFDTE